MLREDPASKITLYQYVRHLFEFKDLPTSANCALKRTGSDNQDTFPGGAKSVHYNFYMNDYLESRPTVEEAGRKAKDLVTLLGNSGFKLTKFVSNIKLPAELQPSEPAPTDEGDFKTGRVLTCFGT